MSTALADTIAITALLQTWGQARDQGRWDVLADTFTPDGQISVTWFHGAFADFVTASRATFQPTGPRTKHLIGTPVVDLHGPRALAETNIQILGRFRIADTDVDNTSYARFLDRLVRGADGWRIQSRIAIYEKDRLDPVAPSAAFAAFMADTDFSAIPEPYRYLGYRLKAAGRPLHDGILCDGTPAALAAYAQAQDWLRAPV